MMAETRRFSGRVVLACPLCVADEKALFRRKSVTGLKVHDVNVAEVVNFSYFRQTLHFLTPRGPVEEE